jgi:hypothetical protein
MAPSSGLDGAMGRWRDGEGTRSQGLGKGHGVLVGSQMVVPPAPAFEPQPLFSLSGSPSWGERAGAAGGEERWREGKKGACDGARGVGWRYRTPSPASSTSMLY